MYNIMKSFIKRIYNVITYNRTSLCLIHILSHHTNEKLFRVMKNVSILVKTDKRLSSLSHKNV